MNSQLLETLRALRADPTRAIDLYPQLFRTSLLVLIQEGSDDSLGSSLFLTYPSSGDVQELPVFTDREFVFGNLRDDAVLIEFPGPPLWKRLLGIVETNRCEAAIDPGQPHGIRLNRQMILGMVAKYGDAGSDHPAA